MSSLMGCSRSSTSMIRTRRELDNMVGNNVNIMPNIKLTQIHECKGKPTTLTY